MNNNQQIPTKSGLFLSSRCQHRFWDAPNVLYSEYRDRNCSGDGDIRFLRNYDTYLPNYIPEECNLVSCSFACALRIASE
jgi:hypothetical protein